MRTRYAREGLLASAGTIHWEAETGTLRCLSVDEQARKLGFPRERWLGEEGFLARTVFAPDRELFLAGCRAAARGARLQAHYRARAADGRTRWFELSLEELRLGRDRCLRGRMVERPPDDIAGKEEPPLIIAHFDRELRHLYVNRGVEEITALPVRYFIGRTNEELGMPARLVRLWREETWRVVQREEGRVVEFEFPPRGGSSPEEPALFLAHLEPVFDAQGNVRSVRCETYRPRPIHRPRPAARASPSPPPPPARERPAAPELLARLHGSLGASTGREDVLRALGQLVGTRLGDWCDVELLQDGVLERTAAFRGQGDTAWETPGQAPTPLARRVALTGVPERLSGPSEQVAAALAPEEAGLLDCMAVPMRLGERLLGVLTFATREPSVRFDADTLALAGNVAGLAAWAFEVDRLRQGEQAARARAAGTEQCLQRQAAELQTLLDILPVGVGIARDPLCRHVQQNTWFARLLDLPLEANMSLSAPEDERPQGVRVLHAGRELRPEEMPLQRAAAAGEVVSDMELDIEVRGRRITVLASATPLLDEAHRPRGSIGSFLDITSRTRAMEAQRFLAESSAALSSSLDPEQTFQMLVRLCVPGLASTAVLFGPRDDGALGVLSMAHADPRLEKLLVRAFQHFQVPQTHPLHDVVRSGRPRLLPAVDEACFWEGNDNPERWHVRQRLALRSAMIIPISSHQRVTNVLVLGSSERTYTQDDCTFAREFASHASSALDNARLYHEAREAVALRDEFLGIAGHELRTPLTALRLGLQNLSRQAAALGQQERLARWINNCLRQGERLGRLVNDLLDVGRLNSERLMLVGEAVDLPALVVEVVGRLRPELEQVGCTVSLALESPLTGYWDRSRLDQVLTNLLSNAAKYGKGRPIEIHASALPGDRVRVSVRDEGIGISPEDQARIFGRFERAVSERHYGGLGLGLWITQQLVLRLGGHIGVRSEQGKGATFTVELPRRVEAVGADAARCPSSARPGQEEPEASEALALMEGETLYRSILAALWEGIVVQDKDGNILTANASAEHILGLSVDQLSGRTSTDPRWRAIHEDGSPFPGEEHPAMVALRTGRPVRNVSMGVQRPDGSRVWLLVNAQPLQRDGEPAPSMVVTSFFDVTASNATAPAPSRGPAPP